MRDLDSPRQRAVFDVNILVEAASWFEVSPRWPSIPPVDPGQPYAQCVGAISDYLDWSLYASPHILETTRYILVNKFGWDRDAATEWIDTIADLCRASGGAVLDPPADASRRDVSGDPEDDLILDLVSAARAHVLVTEDGEHLLPLRSWSGAKILDPWQFPELVAAGRG